METGRRNIQFDMSQQEQLLKRISRAAAGRSLLLRNQAIRLVSHDMKLPSKVLVVHQSYWKTASSEFSELAYVNKRSLLFGDSHEVRGISGKMSQTSTCKNLMANLNKYNLTSESRTSIYFIKTLHSRHVTTPYPFNLPVWKTKSIHSFSRSAFTPKPLLVSTN